MRVLVTLPEWRYGVGQSTRVSEMVRGLSNRVNFRILTRSATHGLDGVVTAESIQISDSYARLLVASDVGRLYRWADVVLVQSGLPYLLAARAYQRRSIYVVMQPDPTWLFAGTERIKRIVVRRLEPLLVRRIPERVIAISPWIADWCLDTYGIQPDIVPDSFDLEEFVPGVQPRNDAGAGREIRLLSVGDWDGFRGRKRTHELVLLLPEIVDSFPEVQLRLVGLSSSATTVLSQLADRLSVSRHVVLIGKVPRLELVSEYQRADVLVASTVVEGFYRPLIEAYACGVPAVVREPVAPNQRVLAAPFQHVLRSHSGSTYNGTAEGLIRGVESCLRRRREFSAAGRQYAVQFDTPRVVPLYLKILEEIGIPAS